MKSITGLVNKVNATNTQQTAYELMGKNLIRGKGLFCGAIVKSQIASPGTTDVLAALVALVNTKFPETGNLVLRRLIWQLRRAYQSNDKLELKLGTVKFIAHLVNQWVAHEHLAIELVTLLLDQPTDDRVQVAVHFVTECGATLSPKGLDCIFEYFGAILHNVEIQRCVQSVIEGLFAIREAQFQGHPAIQPLLYVVSPENQLTHYEISMTDEDVEQELSLDIFSPDPDYLENQKRYLEIFLLGLGDSDDEEQEEASEDMDMNDQADPNLVDIRRRIYLAILSTWDCDEGGRKLFQIELEPGQEMEMCVILVDCCSKERKYICYYGELGQWLCKFDTVHLENFETCFVQQYSSMIHQNKTSKKIGRVASFFAHLLGTDTLPWRVLVCIRLTEEDTTPACIMFVKILFQKLVSYLGFRGLKERLDDPAIQEMLRFSVLPKDSPRNTSFAIHFFTSIGLGFVTQSLRDFYLNNYMPTTSIGLGFVTQEFERLLLEQLHAHHIDQAPNTRSRVFFQ